MATLNTQPDNINFLSPLGFQFGIKKLPGVNYFLQSASVPGITLGETVVGTPFVNLPLIGDHIEYNPFTITFRVDEDMTNYIELYNWMIQLGFPESFNQSKLLYEGSENRSRISDDRPFSDATLTILNSAMNANLSVVYYDAFPTSMGDLVFSTQENSVNHIECQATFRFRSFKIFGVGSGPSGELTTPA